MKGKQKAQTVQLTLPEVMEEEVERAPYAVFGTEHFKVKVASDSLERFQDGLEAENKRGAPRYNLFEKMERKTDYVQARMRPKKGMDITGQQYELEKKALLEKMFEAEK